MNLNDFNKLYIDIQLKYQYTDSIKSHLLTLKLNNRLTIHFHSTLVKQAITTKVKLYTLDTIASLIELNIINS